MNKYHCEINNYAYHPVKSDTLSWRGSKKKNSNIETARQTGGCKKQIVTIKTYTTTGCVGVKTFIKRTICVDF